VRNFFLYSFEIKFHVFSHYLLISKYCTYVRFNHCCRCCYRGGRIGFQRNGPESVPHKSLGGNKCNSLILSSDCIIISLHYCIIVLLYYCIIELLYYCIIVLFCYCIILLLYYCIIVLLYYCIFVLLYYCIIVIL
jgi:hypothetical protein